VIAAIISGVLLVAVLLTGLLRRYASRFGFVDVPNDRSSHEKPTPRGGGVAIVLACLAGWTALFMCDRVSTGLFAALAGGGALVALIGFLDDHRSRSPALRLAVHLAAAGWAVYWLGGMPPLQVGQNVHDLGVTGNILAVLGILWVLNLFNFMDGIDGLAASEAIFVALGGVMCSLVLAASPIVPASLVLAAASAGFLCWNWPPARIFMGDAGSGFLGFVIAVVTIAAAREHPAAPFVYLILGALFFVDATVTLVRRLLRRERLHEAHRTHAYQHLTRRFGHLRVTAGWSLLNVGALLPIAVSAAYYPVWSVAIASSLIGGLALLAYSRGSGRP
jgi:Fuc2NAc and GlcNAc transferase